MGLGRPKAVKLPRQRVFDVAMRRGTWKLGWGLGLAVVAAACSGGGGGGGGGGGDGGGAFSFADAGTPAQNQVCQQQLASTWSRNPPHVGLGTRSSQNSYLITVAALMAQYGVPGGAIAVTRNGHLVATQGIGYSDPGSAQPVNPVHIFRVASVSKQLTSTAIMQLVEQGELALDARVFGDGGVLSSFQPLQGQTLNPQLLPITVRNLLNHSGGWNIGTLGYDPMFDSATIAPALGEPGPATQDDTVRYMLSQPLEYGPGTTYCYSNFGYAVLGAIVEQVSGTDYESYVKQHLLAPVGVSSAYIGDSLASGPEEVTYVNDTGDGTVPSVFPPYPLVPFPYGGWSTQAQKAHGGWAISAVDMLRYAQGMNKYTGGPSLISRVSLDQMLANPGAGGVGVTRECNDDGSTDATSNSQWYGFGFVSQSDGTYWHNGSLPGTTTEDVLTASGYTWTMFFNYRDPAGIFGGAIDQGMWTALGNVASWSTEDYFDQYGPFSPWMSGAQYLAASSQASASNRYPSRAEGRLDAGVAEYRAMFVPLHGGSGELDGVGLDCTQFTAADPQLQAQGYGLVSLQTFTDASGQVRYQATWKTY
jgi:CubicO group peptidase (beta-lactamase class C family)